MKMPTPRQNKIVEEMKDIAADPEVEWRRRLNVANKTDDKAWETATSTWKCPTCNARKVFKQHRIR